MEISFQPNNPKDKKKKKIANGTSLTSRGESPIGSSAGSSVSASSKLEDGAATSASSSVFLAALYATQEGSDASPLTG